ncbi:MAG: hypothetical protein OQK05_04075 [Pseudopelagicola sp.]|nr:hypothetical protein [Pseudopelagicola sp.]
MAGKKTRRQARPTRGSLVAIAGFLIVSGVLRVAIGASEVLAREQESTLAETPPLQDATASCTPPPDIQAVLTALAEREARIEAKESALRDRMHALRIADDRVSEKLQQLTAAEDALSETIALAESASENDLTQLTTVYEAMKPKEAAALFEEMEPEFAAGFLSRMSAEAAAGVLAGLSPQTAYSISVVIAGRNALVPTQ